MFKKFSFLILFILISFSVFSAPYDMILTGDPVLQDLRYLALETGRPFLSFSPPLAPAEIQKFLDLINTETLSPPAFEAYNRIQERLFPTARISYSDETYTLLLDLVTTLEVRVRFNENVTWEPLYPKITPFFSFPFRLSFADVTQLFLEVPIAVQSYQNTNFPFYGNHFSEEHMPVRCFFSAGGNFWNVFIGRDRLYWGSAHTGSLTFSDNSTLFDFARFSLFSSTVKYSMVVNQMPLELKRNLITSDLSVFEDDNLLLRTTQRYYYMHRFDFTIFGRATISLMEGLMVGNSALEVRYLNPFMVFHTLYSWNDYAKWNNGDMTGSLFCLEVNWNIVNNFSFYGQFVMNEIALPGELDYDPDQPPNGTGYLAGFQYFHPFNLWASIFFLEFIYTDPYLNLLSTPFSSFIQMDGGNYYYIGYPRDTIKVTFGTEFFLNDLLRFFGRFSWVCKGEHNKDGLLIWNWKKDKDAFNERTPTGITENKFILTFGSGWNPTSWLSLKADVTGIVSFNNNHIRGKNETGGQTSFYISIKY